MYNFINDHPSPYILFNTLKERSSKSSKTKKEEEEKKAPVFTPLISPLFWFRSISTESVIHMNISLHYHDIPHGDHVEIARSNRRILGSLKLEILVCYGNRKQHRHAEDCRVQANEEGCNRKSEQKRRGKVTVPLQQI